MPYINRIIDNDQDNPATLQFIGDLKQALLQLKQLRAADPENTYYLTKVAAPEWKGEREPDGLHE
jgi:hypothetical protein